MSENSVTSVATGRTLELSSRNEENCRKLILSSMRIGQWRTQEKISGRVQGRGSGLVGGRGAEPPGRRRIFENLQKIPEENCKKYCIFAYFAKKFQNNELNFGVFGRKKKLFGKILRKF